MLEKNVAKSCAIEDAGKRCCCWGTLFRTNRANISSESPCMPSALPFGRFRMHLTTSSGVNVIGLV